MNTLRREKDAEHIAVQVERYSLSFDEGRASARLQMRLKANPYDKHLEPRSYDGWNEGFASYMVAN